MPGKGGCGAASGSGGGAGSPGLGKACSYFCPRFPYQSCSSDFENPRDCLDQCQGGFGLGPWCEYALVDFLVCAAPFLNPNAVCMDDGQFCYGPGCTLDAFNACAAQYFALAECERNPRPVPPCPPPPNPPLPPNCSQGVGVGPDMCERVTDCPNVQYLTQCYYEFEGDNSWLCDCYLNGNYRTTVGANGNVGTVCQTAAAICGFP
jgi:hypothetical protein